MREFRLGPWSDRHRRPFGRQCDLNQSLNQLSRLPDVYPQPVQQCEPKAKLDERDRGKRFDALPRPDLG
jgi:hypothetical protein